MMHRCLNVNYSCRVLLPHQQMLRNNFSLLIDAHGSDVAQSFPMGLTLFG